LRIARAILNAAIGMTRSNVRNQFYKCADKRIILLWYIAVASLTIGQGFLGIPGGCDSKLVSGELCEREQYPSNLRRAAAVENN
jgi:hypothetical protein